MKKIVTIAENANPVVRTIPRGLIIGVDGPVSKIKVDDANRVDKLDTQIITSRAEHAFVILFITSNPSKDKKCRNTTML